MSSAVDQVLSRRARQPGGRPAALSLGAAGLLHVVVLAAAWILPRLAPPRPPIEFVPVTVLPAQALGVPRPAAREKEKDKDVKDTKDIKDEEPAPAPVAPEPPPKAREPEPDPEPPPRPAAPVLPRAEPERRPAPAPPPRPATAPVRPVPVPAAPPSPTPDNGDQLGRRGGAAGSALGTTAMGSQIAGLDNPDFTYGYYIDRLLAAIDSNWARPRVEGNVRAIVSFRLQRDGSLTDLTIKEPSGYNAFDLAALRAVQNAAPFPPLPRAYRRDSLGVNLIVR